MVLQLRNKLWRKPSPSLPKSHGKEPQSHGLVPEGHMAGQTQLDPAAAGKGVQAPHRSSLNPQGEGSGSLGHKQALGILLWGNLQGDLEPLQS